MSKIIKPEGDSCALVMEENDCYEYGFIRYRQSEENDDEKEPYVLAIVSNPKGRGSIKFVPLQADQCRSLLWLLRKMEQEGSI